MRKKNQLVRATSTLHSRSNSANILTVSTFTLNWTHRNKIKTQSCEQYSSFASRLSALYLLGRETRNAHLSSPLKLRRVFVCFAQKWRSGARVAFYLQTKKSSVFGFNLILVSSRYDVSTAQKCANLFCTRSKTGFETGEGGVGWCEVVAAGAAGCPYAGRFTFSRSRPFARVVWV